MPLLMIIAEWKWLRSKDEVYLTLPKRWAKGTAILFAVGAVSGTVLSFELGLLWPGFMGYAGSIIGMPFSLEGFAFFTEAIFLGIYLYGWQRVPPRAHLFAGAMVAVSGALSGIFVVIANAWMNAPTGFRLVDGKPVDVDPIAAMMNTAAFPQTLHMTLAALCSDGICRRRHSRFYALARSAQPVSQSRSGYRTCRRWRDGDPPTVKRRLAGEDSSKDSAGETCRFRRTVSNRERRATSHRRHP